MKDTDLETEDSDLETDDDNADRETDDAAASGRAHDFILGLDLGQSHDFSALAILERRRVKEEPVNHYSLLHLQRWPLKTSYPDIVAEVCKLVRTKPLKRPLLAVDQTGVGLPIVDMFRKAQVKASLNPILIGSGHEITHERGVWHVPKKELVSTMQLLLQSQRIKFAKVPMLKTLLDELGNFKVKISINANESFEAWRERDHDDLVLALAMAAWLGEGGAPYFEVASGVDMPRSRHSSFVRQLLGLGPRRF